MFFFLWSLDAKAAGSYYDTVEAFVSEAPFGRFIMGHPVP